MAKQRGLHQIKGKVGEFSYYSQTGVSGGLIRKINEGLSARVKTDAAYANTRLNNLEFGAAANTAALLGQAVMPKFRPMILPFSQSRMAKEVLKLARQNSSAWGQRTVSSSQTEQLAAILTAQSKLKASDFIGISLNYDSGDTFDVDLVITDTQATMLADLGINTIACRFAIYNVATGNYNAMGREMATGYINLAEAVNYETPAIVAGTEITSSESIGAAEFIPAPNHSGHQLFVAVIMPQRSINGTSHILQEYCSFVCLTMPVRE